MPVFMISQFSVLSSQFNKKNKSLRSGTADARANLAC